MVERLGLEPGRTLHFTLTELDFDNSGIVESIEPCPPIADGDGQVVISRFATRQVEEITRIDLSDGTQVTGTSVHPVWSVDREDWVALGELEEGETLQARDGELTIESVTTTLWRQPVYNIEVQGEHVYEVGEAGILVHNAGPGKYQVNTLKNASKTLGKNLRKRGLGRPGRAHQAAHVVPTQSFARTLRRQMVKDAIVKTQEAFNRTLGAAARNRAVNGFWAKRGHLGTHKDKFFLRMGELLGNQTTAQGMGRAMQQLKKEIFRGDFLK